MLFEDFTHLEGTPRVDSQAQMRWALERMFGPNPVFQGKRIDANESAIFARQLEWISTETYNYEYPELAGRTIFPFLSGVPTGAETHTYRMYDQVGKAKFINDYATDFPNVEILGQEFTGKIRALGVSYQYSVQDLRAAAMANIQLSAEKARMARLAIETEVDRILAYGDTNHGLIGIASPASTTLFPETTKGSQASGTNWSTATPAEILKDVRAMFSKVWLGTKTVHRANTLLLDTYSYDLLVNTDYSLVNGGQTIVTGANLLNYIQANVPGLQRIIPWIRLDTASPINNKARIFAGDFNPRVIAAIEPQPFEQFPLQTTGMAFITPCHERNGGLVIRYPNAITFMDGVAP